MTDFHPIFVSREQIFHEFNPTTLPVVEIYPGEIVTFETWDCWQGAVKQEIRTAPADFRKMIGKTCPGMPMTGPVALRGAQPGDILMAEILSIEVDSPGWTMASGGEGATRDILSLAENRLVPIEGGRGLFKGRYTLPLRPMIGCIGTTPLKAIGTGWPGRHGGNLDCKEITAGATLFLPVELPGAMFGLGDLHAMQGDGEVSGTAVEINGKVTARLSLLRNANFPLPLLATPTALATIASEPTLDAAAKLAVEVMTLFLARLTGEPPADIAMLLCQVGDIRICQLVDPAMTCRMEVPRSFIENELKIDLEKLWERYKI